MLHCLFSYLIIITCYLFWNEHETDTHIQMLKKPHLLRVYLRYLVTFTVRKHSLSYLQIRVLCWQKKAEIKI